MKKILNGVRYDTKKATLIGGYSNIGSGADSHSDFRYWEADLYVTPRSGKFFIAGSGGPMSRFSQSAGQNSWSGGEDLVPMSKEEALEWAENYLDAETVEEFFGDMIQDA